MSGTGQRAHLMHELRASFGMLTVFPVATSPRRRWSVLGLAPVVGLVLGGAAAGLVMLAGLAFTGPSGALLVAVLTIAGLALLTRGLHLDGLADTADGLGPLGSAQTRLAVMRRPDVGAFGVATLTLVLLTDCAALARDITAGRGAAAILVAVATGRLVMTQAGVPGIPPAHADGLGAQVAQSVPRPLAWGLTALVLLATTSCLALAPAALVIRLDLAVLAGCLAAAMLRRHLVRRLGGITGDVLGALCEVATCVCLVVTALG